MKLRVLIILTTLLLTSCRVPSNARRIQERADLHRDVAAWVESAEGRATIAGALEESFAALLWHEAKKLKGAGAGFLAALLAAGGWLRSSVIGKNGKAKGTAGVGP